jgi:hypothetical protein
MDPTLDSPYFHRIRLRASSQAPQHQSSWNILAEVNEQVLHYSRMGADLSWPTNKLLWIMADTEERCDLITRNMSDVLDSALHDGLALEVDVSKTHSVFWPLVGALTGALPAFREEIGKHPPWWFAENLGQRVWDVPPSSPTSPYNSLDEQHSLTVCERYCIGSPAINAQHSTGDRPGFNFRAPREASKSHTQATWAFASCSRRAGHANSGASERDVRYHRGVGFKG